MNPVEYLSLTSKDALLRFTLRSGSISYRLNTVAVPCARDNHLFAISPRKIAAFTPVANRHWFFRCNQILLSLVLALGETSPRNRTVPSLLLGYRTSLYCKPFLPNNKKNTSEAVPAVLNEAEQRNPFKHPSSPYV